MGLCLRHHYITSCHRAPGVDRAGRETSNACGPHWGFGINRLTVGCTHAGVLPSLSVISTVLISTCHTGMGVLCLTCSFLKSDVNLNLN